ncbi:MAG TPA: hypothetical protein VEG39_03520 [Clostridia bacterium]|nr:hypothetical protein [Clostridia bacterium]
MPWVISFISSWIVFFALVDYKTLNKNIYGGILALTLASLVDYGGQQLELYKFYDIIISWAGCSAFYKFGPIFTMGIIFCQYVPRDKRLQAVNIFVSSILYILLEISIIKSGVAEYIHWNTAASFVINILTFGSLTWLTLAFLRDG